MPARWLSQWVESWRCTSSQHNKRLCLSLLMSEKLKLKKVNKISYLNQESRLCFVFFGFLYAYEHYERFMHVNILVVFLDLYVTFHLSLNDRKSPHFSRTLPSIRANLNSDLVWIVLIRPLISNSSCPPFQTFLDRYFTPSEFFTLQVSSGLEESYQYSSRFR